MLITATQTFLVCLLSSLSAYPLVTADSSTDDLHQLYDFLFLVNAVVDSSDETHECQVRVAVSLR
jgi:hypothetical protein